MDGDSLVALENLFGPLALEPSLTGRLFSRNPAAGYALWLDTADATHIYIAEAPTASTGASTDFRGIRVPKDAGGNPVGKVQTATGFTWDSRKDAVATAWA